VIKIDVLVSLSQQGYDRYIGGVDSSGIGIHDGEIVPKEIKDYLFPLGDSSIPARFAAGVIESRKKGRKKYDEFIRGLIKDFDEAKICPQCKDIYYDYTVVDFPHTYCVKCKTGDNKSVELVTTFEYKKRLSGK